MCKLVSMKLYGGGELLVAEHKKEHILKYMMMLGTKGFLPSDACGLSRASCSHNPDIITILQRNDYNEDNSCRKTYLRGGER